MGFIAVVAFCTVASLGHPTPQPPYACAWADDSYVFKTETACAMATQRMMKDPQVRLEAERNLVSVFGPQKQMTWFTFCPPQHELRDFYKTFGVTDLGDISEEA